MNPQDYREAKSMFFKYRGNGFYMWRNEELEKYEAFNVSKDTEKMWIKELGEEFVDKLEIEINFSQIELIFGYLCELITSPSHSTELLTYLIKFLETRKSQLDSFTLILLAEQLLRGVKAYDRRDSPDTEVSARAKKLALGVLEELLHGPITVSDDYDYMKITYDFSEENLRDRIEGVIQHWEDKQW